MYLREITLLAGDLSAECTFYTQILGLPVLSQSWDGFTVQVGESRLRFEHSVIPDVERRGAYHFAFNIPENQLAAGAAWLAARKPLIADVNGQTVIDFPNWHAHSVYAFDPAGNVIELIARHRLPNATERAFDAASLLNVSELGVSTENVPAQVDALVQQLSVPIFEKSGSATFTALGDDHGLLIVVQHGRMWYPNTAKIADAWPIQIQVETESRTAMLSI